MSNATTASAQGNRIDEHVGTIVGSIGAKLHHIRKVQRLSLQQLATKADVSAAAIHKIEHSDMVPTVTTLLKIATALECSAGYFIEDDRFAEPVAFTPAAARSSVYTPHHGLTLDGVSGPYAPFRCAAAVATIEPGASSGSKPQVHPGEELLYMLDGTLVFEILAQRYELTPGDSLHFIGDQAHRWANETSEPAHAMWFVLRDS